MSRCPNFLLVLYIPQSTVLSSFSARCSRCIIQCLAEGDTLITLVQRPFRSPVIDGTPSVQKLTFRSHMKYFFPVNIATQHTEHPICRFMLGNCETEQYVLVKSIPQHRKDKGRQVNAWAYRPSHLMSIWGT
jgi:hypothetical protein